MTFIQLTLDPTGSNIAQATGVRLDDASGTGQTIPVSRPHEEPHESQTRERWTSMDKGNRMVSPEVGQS